MQTVFITGVAGFIGSNLAKQLIKKNKIVGLDDFNDYYSPKIKSANLRSLLKHHNIHIYQGDIRDQKLLEKIFQENKIDKIIHLAARAGVRPSLENPQLYISVNIGGTLNILEIAKKYRVKQFIFASSSSVYGNNKKVPFTESDIVDQPISPYAISKLAGEKLCWLYHDAYKIPITILRFFSVYGPHGRPDMAPYKFVKKILNDDTIEIFGDGSQARDFTYIDDIVNGIEKSLSSPKMPAFSIINLGNSYPVSVKELVSIIENASGKKAKVCFLKKRLGDVERTFADIRLAKKILHWQPKTRMDEGMKKFIAWFLQTQFH